MAKKIILDSMLQRQQLSFSEGKFVSHHGEYDVFVAIRNDIKTIDKNLYNPRYFVNNQLTINITEDKYSNLLTEFCCLNEKFDFDYKPDTLFSIFNKYKYFLSKNTTQENNQLNRERFNRRQSSRKIPPYNTDYKIIVGGKEIKDCLFEFKSIWILESNYFALIVKAINLYNKDISDREPFEKFFQNYQKLWNNTWGYSFIRDNKILREALVEITELSKLHRSFFWSSFKNIFVHHRNSFNYIPPLPNQIESEFNDEDESIFFNNMLDNYNTIDNIENIPTKDLKDFTKKFILNSLNLFLNQTANLNLVYEQNKFETSSIANGLRGILVELCINFLKSKKGMNNCKNCSNPIITPLGAGNKTFCSNKCRNSVHYNSRKDAKSHKEIVFIPLIKTFTKKNIKVGLKELKLKVPRHGYVYFDFVSKYEIHNKRYDNIFALTEVSNRELSLLSVDKYAGILNKNDDKDFFQEVFMDDEPIFHNKKNILCILHFAPNEIGMVIKNKYNNFKTKFFKEVPTSDEIVKEYEEDEAPSLDDTNKLFQSFKFGA